MAIPFKKGLEYFPLDSNFLSNWKTQRLIHRFGCNGICVYLGILCEIYGENGYYIPFSDNFCFDKSRASPHDSPSNGKWRECVNDTAIRNNS